MKNYGHFWTYFLVSMNNRILKKFAKKTTKLIMSRNWYPLKTLNFSISILKIVSKTPASISSALFFPLFVSLPQSNSFSQHFILLCSFFFRSYECFTADDPIFLPVALLIVYNHSLAALQTVSIFWACMKLLFQYLN